jgi:hypothetical protein
MGASLMVPTGYALADVVGWGQQWFPADQAQDPATAPSESEGDGDSSDGGGSAGDGSGDAWRGGRRSSSSAKDNPSWPSCASWPPLVSIATSP